MIALDTNVLIRYLIADDALQTPRALRLIDEAGQQGQVVFISQIVLCETEWVLRSIYGAARQEVHDILRRLLRTQPFQVEDADQVDACLDLYRTKRGDLSDFLLGEVGRAAGATSTFTFDRALQREAGFTLL